MSLDVSSSSRASQRRWFGGRLNALFGEAWARRHRRRRHQIGLVGVVLGAAALALALVLGFGTPSPAAPVRTTDAVAVRSGQSALLAVGAPAGPVKAADANRYQGPAIPSTVALVAETGDVRPGLPWGLRAFRTTRGQTCLQVGRVEQGTIGVIGDDGAWGGDGQFHPIAANAYTADSCSPTDRNGYAFNNVVTGAVTSADVQWGLGLQGDGCGGRGEPECPAGSSRTLAYGLLGPDAVSITYTGAGGRLFSEPTNGPLGAYLIVSSRSPRAVRGQTSTATLFSGPVVSVSYRDGQACTVPAPPGQRADADAIARFARAGCRPVGYVAPRVRRASSAAVAAPIHVQQLPARHYCVSGPETIAPCQVGQTPLPGETRYLLVDITFVARVAISTTNSKYQQTEMNPPGIGCVGGLSDSATLTNVHAGQRVLFQDQIPAGCHGVIHGTIGYTPGSLPHGAAAVVGHYEIHLR